MSASTRSPGPLTFRSGGAVLLLALLLVAAASLWRIQDLRSSRGSRAVGDGRHPATYGFDLREARVPVDLVVASGLPRDGLRVLDDPPAWPTARVDSLARVRRGKYLVPSDRVIGVTRNGRSRAYPILALNWHEVVNDTLGGSPILITYSPLCDAVAVYDRSDGGGGDPAPLRFGHSGLLYNSDLLLYDRRPGHAGESLWIQLTGEAISGPASRAAHRLRSLPCALLCWEDWKRGHPETTVLARDPALQAQYKRDPYVSYYGNDLLRFPVRPVPSSVGRLRKTPGLVLESSGRTAWFPIERSVGAEPSAGAPPQSRRVSWNGIALRLFHRGQPPTAWIEPDDAFVASEPAGRRPGGVPEGNIAFSAPAPHAARTDIGGGSPGEESRGFTPGPGPRSIELPAVRYAFWFAWYAMSGGQAEEGRWVESSAGH